MADDVDRAEALEQIVRDEAVAKARILANIPEGVAGECDMCGKHSSRLVRGCCAPCRDKYKLG